MSNPFSKMNDFDVECTDVGTHNDTRSPLPREMIEIVALAQPNIKNVL